jgi:catechol 2,3-dioxygenase-like lactoylglutathione lyase family enzyme
MPRDTAAPNFSIDHVGFDVDDLPAQIDFYRRAFDLEIWLEGDVPEYIFRPAMLVSPTG